MKKRLFAFWAAVVLTLFLVFPLLPTDGGTLRETVLGEDGDELLGMGSSYFVLTPDRELVGWGSGALGRLGSQIWFTRPYLLRRTIARDVLDFSCGPSCTLYVTGGHVLYGWGGDPEILLTEHLPDLIPTRILEDISKVAVGYGCAAAVKTDGTLWAWGNLESGISRHAYQPVQVMKGVQDIQITDGLPFAITEERELCVFSKGFLHPPTKLAEDTVSVTWLDVRDHLTYAYLTTSGAVHRLEFDPEMQDGSLLTTGLIAEDVRSLCDGGIVKRDGTLWDWQETSDGTFAFVKAADHVAQASSTRFYLCGWGNLHMGEGSSLSLCSVCGVSPRVHFGLLAAALMSGFFLRRRRTPAGRLLDKG